MNRLASAAGWLPIAFLVLLASPACTSVLNAGRQDNGASTGHGAGGSNGTAGGATGATTGGCQANGTECSGNDRCCSGSCDTTCRQGSGDQCLGDNDCSSLNCVNEHCACSGANPNERGYCATDQDCCWDGGCSLAIYQGAQWGFCCRSVGEDLRQQGGLLQNPERRGRRVPVPGRRSQLLGGFQRVLFRRMRERSLQGRHWPAVHGFQRLRQRELRRRGLRLRDLLLRPLQRPRGCGRGTLFERLRLLPGFQMRDEPLHHAGRHSGPRWRQHLLSNT